MKITIESTDEMTHVNGAVCRRWHGVTAAGLPCIVFVTRIAIEQPHQEAFARETEGSLRSTGGANTPDGPAMSPNVFDRRMLT